MSLSHRSAVRVL